MKLINYYLGDILPFLFVIALIFVLIRYIKCKKTGVFYAKREVLLLIFTLYLSAVFLKTVVPEQLLKLDFSSNPFTPISKAFVFNNPVQTNIYIRSFVIEHLYFRLFDVFILNFILLIPFGFLFPVLFPKRKEWTVLIAFLISCSIELLQLFTPRITDTYDIFLNTLGALFGFIIYLIYQKIKKRRKA